MAADDDVDTSRSVVKTYVPAYQKDEWQRHADELGMNQSEFVRSMVQAGRRGFLEDGGGESDPDGDVEGAVGNGGDLADRVEEVLSTDEHRSWDELLAALTDDIEDRLEAALTDLQEANRVRYSGRNGGYTLVDE